MLAIKHMNFCLQVTPVIVVLQNEELRLAIGFARNSPCLVVGLKLLRLVSQWVLEDDSMNERSHLLLEPFM